MNTTFEKYLNSIDSHLRPLPASERADIIREIESSILEMENEGLSEEQIAERLGAPRELAKAYLGDFLEKSFDEKKSLTKFTFNNFSFENNGRFHLNRFLTVLAFYSLTGFSGMFLIPILGIMAPALMFCGVIAPLAGLLKLVFSLFGYDTSYVIAQFGEMTLSPAPTFLFSVVMGVILFLLGKGAWKLLLYYLRTVSKVKRDWAV